MASSTTNLGLIKPAGNEKIRIAQINQNSDTIDNAIGAVGSTSLQAQVSAIEDGIAIVANGDSHVAITAGQFVYVRNNTHNLAEGLYVASANVSANASITSSNMTADASGGLNALNAKISDKANRIIIAENTDLNTLLVTGLYRSPTTISGVATLTNCPLSAPFVMAVAGNETAGGTTTGVVQIVANGDGVFARRATSSGFPSDWTEFAKKGDIKTTSFTGTTDSAGNIMLKDSNGNTITVSYSILSVASTIGYCTQASPGSGGWYVKVLTGSETSVSAVANTQGTFYIRYAS